MNCAENIRFNSLLQLIHEVTIEFRFQKPLAQERFKSNLEFRYKIIVSTIKFRKGFVKPCLRKIVSEYDQEIPQSQTEALNSKHGVKMKIKTAYDKYLELQDILDLNGESGEEIRAFSRKKLFSFLKGSKTDAQGIALLKNGDNVYTNDVDKANLLNAQFQSVCSIREPLNLIKLCHTTNNNKLAVYRNKMCYL